MKSPFLEETHRDFKEFIEGPALAPPKTIREQLFQMVERELNPSSWLIFGKMTLIHFLTSLFTLSICPQFGLRVFGEGLGIMRWFLKLGTYGCSALCGALFVGASLFLGSLVLKIEEIRVLRSHRFLQILTLALLSLGGFIMAEAEILWIFGLVWTLGSLVGGIGMLEIGRWIRQHRQHSAFT